MKRLAMRFGLVVISMAMIAGNMYAMDASEAGMSKETPGSLRNWHVVPLPLPKKLVGVGTFNQQSSTEKLVKAAMVACTENRLRVSQ